MKITVNKENLLYGLTYVNRVIPVKSEIPYLNNVFIKTKKDELELFGTDMEEGIKTSIPAQIEEEGEILINSKIFIDMVRKLPEGKPIQIVERDSNINITSGKSNYKIVKFSPEEFPKFPEIEGYGVEFAQNQILDIIKKVKFSTSSGDQYPALRGIHFIIENDFIEAFSTDGLRISYVKKKLDKSNEKNISFTLPLKAILNLERFLLPDEGVKFLVKVNENQFYAKLEKIEIYTRLLKAEYPDLHEFVNMDDFLFSILIPKGELKEVLNRVGVLLTPESNAVKFLISGNKMKIETETPELGLFEEEIDIINSDENIRDFTIAFSQKFLMDFIDVIRVDEIEISFRKKEGTEEKAVRLRGAGVEDYIYILMPYTLSD